MQPTGAPGDDLCQQAPKEWPITAVSSSAPITRKVIRHLRLSCVRHFGCAFGFGHRFGIVRPSRRHAVYPASSKTVAHRSQLLGSSHKAVNENDRCSTDALARSISSVSVRLVVLHFGTPWRFVAIEQDRNPANRRSAGRNCLKGQVCQAFVSSDC